MLASLNSSYFQLHLLEGGLHADINGDGVLDHVQVHITHLSRFRLFGFTMELHLLRPYILCAHHRLSEAMWEREL